MYECRVRSPFSTKQGSQVMISGRERSGVGLERGGWGASGKGGGACVSRGLPVSFPFVPPASSPTFQRHSSSFITDRWRFAYSTIKCRWNGPLLPSPSLDPIGRGARVECHYTTGIATVPYTGSILDAWHGEKTFGWKPLHRACLPAMSLCMPVVFRTWMCS